MFSCFSLFFVWISCGKSAHTKTNRKPAQTEIEKVSVKFYIVKNANCETQVAKCASKRYIISEDEVWHISMPETYTSIKSEVLAKLQSHFPELQERFGISAIGIFGSVSRGEYAPESDVDIVYSFHPGRYAGMLDCMRLVDYLEELFGRNVDIVSVNGMKPYFRAYVEPELIFAAGGEKLHHE